MRRSRDIWAVPPGGFPEDVKALRRSYKPVIAALLVILIGLGGAALHASLNRSTPVAAADALAEFREGRDAKPGGDKGSSGREIRKQDSSRTKTAGGRSRRPATGPASRSNAATPVPGADAPDAGKSSGGGGAVRTSGIGAPQEGVYTWSIDGYERAPGVNRRLPERSHRVITHNGARAWTEHMMFSEQREQWVDLVVSEEGVATTKVRNRVEMGPIEVDRTVDYNPPAFVSRFPLRVGAAWEGSWKGKTRGEYQAETFEHRWLTIGGEKVEVWAAEVRMTLHGEVEGTVVTRSWVAPDYRLVVKQYQEMTVESGPGNYYCEWSGQVLSLDPQT